jgi:hypothetical protein
LKKWILKKDGYSTNNDTNNNEINFFALSIRYFLLALIWFKIVECCNVFFVHCFSISILTTEKITYDINK